MINNFVHVQFHVPDIHKAKSFFSSLFKWDFFSENEFAIYFKIDESAEWLGGSFRQTDDFSATSSTRLVVNVKSPKKTLEKAIALGGEIVEDIVQTGQYGGYYASFKCNQGIIMGIWGEEE